MNIPSRVDEHTVWYEFSESRRQSPERMLWEQIKQRIEYSEPSIVTKSLDVTWFGWDHTPEVISVDKDGIIIRYPASPGCSSGA